MDSGDEGARRQTMELLAALLRPWHAAVEAPAQALDRVLAGRPAVTVFVKEV